MKSDQEIMRSIRAAIDDCTRGIDDAPSLRGRIARKAKGEEPVVKKITTSFIIVLVLMVMTATALAATWLWQEAGEKVAPMEGQNGYYDTWSVEAKMELVRTLCDLGELKEHADVKTLLDSPDMSSEERNALCDEIMSAYVKGTPDTVTLLSILETLHGDMSTWSMEDKVWYNELLSKNDMLSAEDTNYVLPEGDELTMEQAIEAAKGFLIRQGAEHLQNAHMEATMIEEESDSFYGETQIQQKGRRLWSVVFRPEAEGLPYGGVYRADVATDGSVINYGMPDLVPLFITGVLPDADAIEEEQALEIGVRAIASQTFIAREELTGVRVFFGYVDISDEEAAHAQLGERVWAVDTEQNYYALLSPVGEVIYVGSHR